MLWEKVERLIAIRQPKSYDQAVELLADLRDLAARKDEIGFRRQIEALRAAHGGKLCTNLRNNVFKCFRFQSQYSLRSR